MKTVLDKKAAEDKETVSLMTPSVREFQVWFARVGQVETLLGRALVSVAAERVATLTSEVSKLTPVYSHFIMEKKINVAMVRKTLLPSKIRGALSEKAIALHRAKSLATLFQAEWGVSPEPQPGECEEDPKETELACAEMALQEAKKAISVIAACSVVYENGGGPRQAEAATLVAQERPEIVKPLWDELVKISKGKQATKVDETMAE